MCFSRSFLLQSYPLETQPLQTSFLSSVHLLTNSQEEEREEEKKKKEKTQQPCFAIEKKPQQMQRLGLNVFPFLFCSGLLDLFALRIWRSDCYTLFPRSTLTPSLLAADQERGRESPRREHASTLSSLQSPPVTLPAPPR